MDRVGKVLDEKATDLVTGALLDANGSRRHQYNPMREAASSFMSMGTTVSTSFVPHNAHPHEGIGPESFLWCNLA